MSPDSGKPQLSPCIAHNGRRGLLLPGQLPCSRSEVTGSCAARRRAAARGGEQAEDGCSKKSTSETFHFAPVSSSPDPRATCLAYRYMSIPRRLVCARAFLIQVRVQVLHPYTPVHLQPCVSLPVILRCCSLFLGTRSVRSRLVAEAGVPEVHVTAKGPLSRDLAVQVYD